MKKINGIVIDCDDIDTELDVAHDLEALFSTEDPLFLRDGDDLTLTEKQKAGEL